MRAFKTRMFARDAEALGLTDIALSDAIRELQEGLVDANLGNNLFKKRIAVGNKGKRGGLRTIIDYQAAAGRLFCIHIFAKNQMKNITEGELRIFEKLGKDLLLMSDTALTNMIDSKKLLEVKLD